MIPRAPEGPGEVVLDAAAVQAEVVRLGAEISRDHADTLPHLVAVLKGAAIFIADLMRALTVPATVDFISIAPYEGASDSGVVRIRKDLDDPIEGRSVVVVQGLCAGGRSLAYLLRNFETRRPASLRVCALLVKRRPRRGDAWIDYVGREIPDVFVVGYGLDARERYRNLPYIARLG
jgi:hypoxanthine phosphoribosyltransferase